MTLAAAVALGALVGPAQVGARVIEMLIGQLSSSDLDDGRVGELAGDRAWPAVGPSADPRLALVFYGAGIGIESIARGTLPLALFGARATRRSWAVSQCRA